MLFCHKSLLCWFSFSCLFKSVKRLRHLSRHLSRHDVCFFFLRGGTRLGEFYCVGRSTLKCFRYTTLLSLIFGVRCMWKVFCSCVFVYVCVVSLWASLGMVLQIKQHNAISSAIQPEIALNRIIILFRSMIKSIRVQWLYAMRAHFLHQSFVPTNDSSKQLGSCHHLFTCFGGGRFKIESATSFWSRLYHEGKKTTDNILYICVCVCVCFWMLNRIGRTINRFLCFPLPNWQMETDCVRWWFRMLTLNVQCNGRHDQISNIIYKW